MLEPAVFTQATRDYVRSIALRIVKDASDAEDVTQDALLLAFRYRASFRGDSLYSTWLHRVTQTAALMYLRKRRRYRREIGERDGDRPDEVGALLERAATPATALSSASCHEQIDRTRNVVAGLGERYPEVFWMRYAQGYTETEIARNLGLSLATVKTRAHRARRAVAADCMAEAAEQAVAELAPARRAA